MLKVLVVDDETLILEGLAEGINWNRLKCYRPFLAKNGLEAIDIIEKNDIDIIITDIKMPGMDGLELAEWVYTNKKGIHVIILSGYDDFIYAQNAMRFGVTDYILKPTKLDELEKSIKKAARSINEQNRLDDLFNKSKAIIKQSDRQAIIDSFIFDRISDAGRIKNALKNSYKNKYPYKIVVIQMYNYSENFINKSDYILQYIKYIEEILERINTDKNIDVLTRYERDEILLYFSANCSHMADEYFSQTVELLLHGLKENLDEVAPIDTVFGCSRTDRNIDNLKNMYLEALEQCDVQKQSFLPIENYSTKKEGIQELLNSNFRDYLQNRNYQALMKDIDKVFQKCLDKTTAYVKGLAIELIHAVLCCGEELLSGHIDMQKVYGDIINSCDRKKTFDIVKDFIKNLCGYINSRVGNENNGNILIDRIAAYIKRNFFNDLSLESVAEHFYISPGHLSRLFRKYYKTTFLSFLTRIRIKNAKILLQNPRYKVYEVGSMVGFNDSKYFSQTFKKLTGKTPSEFKKR